MSKYPKPEQGSDDNPDVDGLYLYDIIDALKRMGIHIDPHRLKRELFNNG